MTTSAHCTEAAVLTLSWPTRTLSSDPALAQRLASQIPPLIHATGPVSYDFQFGQNNLLARVVEASWLTPDTFFAASYATVIMDGNELAGLELSFPGADFYHAKSKLAALAPNLLSSGQATLEELLGLTARAEEASYLNAHVPDHAYYLLAIASMPSHRGRGVGKALLLAAIERARSAGFQEFQLDVLADNPAVEFYLANGLRIVSKVEVPRLTQDHGFPAELRMALSL